MLEKRFMPAITWILAFAYVVTYIASLFTVCRSTFRKGYRLLGIAGFFVLPLWLVGATRPALAGSKDWVDELVRSALEPQRLDRR